MQQINKIKNSSSNTRQNITYFKKSNQNKALNINETRHIPNYIAKNNLRTAKNNEA